MWYSKSITTFSNSHFVIFLWAKIDFCWVTWQKWQIYVNTLGRMDKIFYHWTCHLIFLYQIIIYSILWYDIFVELGRKAIIATWECMILSNSSAGKMTSHWCLTAECCLTLEDCFHIYLLNAESFSVVTLNIIVIRGHSVKLLQKSIPAIKNFIIILRPIFPNLKLKQSIYYMISLWTEKSNFFLMIDLNCWLDKLAIWWHHSGFLHTVDFSIFIFIINLFNRLIKQ